MSLFHELESPAQYERRCLRDSAGYIGAMMVSLEAAMFLLGILLQFLSGLFSMDLQSFLLIYAVIYSVGMALPAVVVSRVMGRRYSPFTPARSIDPPDAFFGILSAVGICMTANIVVNVLMLFFESVGVPEPQMPDYLQPNVSSLLLNLFVFAVLPALFEELVFRGYVLSALRVHGDWFAVIVSALLFGLMHGNVAQIPFALIVGIALGWLYIMTDNFWIPVAVHLINNGFSFLLQYYALGLGDVAKSKLNAFAIFALIVIGALSLAVLIARRSALFRRIPHRSCMTGLGRVSALLSAPMFVVCIVVFVLLTVMDVLGSMS